MRHRGDARVARGQAGDQVVAGRHTNRRRRRRLGKGAALVHEPVHRRRPHPLRPKRGNAVITELIRHEEDDVRLVRVPLAVKQRTSVIGDGGHGGVLFVVEDESTNRNEC